MELKFTTHKINRNLQTIIFIVLSAFYFFSNLYNQEGFLDISLNIIIGSLVLVAVWKLFINHFNFASYFVLLIIGYFDGAFEFIKYLLSFNMTSGFALSFSWINLVFLVGSIFLILMAIYFFHEEGGLTFNKESFNLDLLLILFSVLIFLSYGANTLIAVLIVEVVAWNYRPLSSHYLMLSKSIVFPFKFIKVALDGNLLNNSAYFWITSILAVFVIFLIIKDFYSEYTKPKECHIDDKPLTE